MPAEYNENYSLAKSCVNLEPKSKILETSLPPLLFCNDIDLQNTGLLLRIDVACCLRRCNTVKIAVFHIHCFDMIIQSKENKYQVYSWVKY